MIEKRQVRFIAYLFCVRKENKNMEKKMKDLLEKTKVNYYNEIDDEQSFKIFKEIYEKTGDKEAEYFLGSMYFLGIGTEQNFIEDTKNLMAVLKYNYWCEDENEKKYLKKMFKDNEYKYQEKLREKYNPDNIFKNRQHENINANTNSNLPIEVKKENFFKKLINFIKRIIIK